MSINATLPDGGLADFGRHLLETARKLFLNGDYGGAINALLPYAEHDREAARVTGECLR